MNHKIKCASRIASYTATRIRFYASTRTHKIVTGLSARLNAKILSCRNPRNTNYTNHYPSPVERFRIVKPIGLLMSERSSSMHRAFRNSTTCLTATHPQRSSKHSLRIKSCSNRPLPRTTQGSQSHCWALFLRAFNYSIEIVPGDTNTRPDIMTRWIRGYRKTSTIFRIARSIPIKGVPVSPNTDEFALPSPSEIA